MNAAMRMPQTTGSYNKGSLYDANRQVLRNLACLAIH